MRRDRPFWKESDSTAMLEEPSILHADEARQSQRLIGAQLRQWYEAVAQEPVPAEWLALLDQSGRDGQAENNRKVGTA